MEQKDLENKVLAHEEILIGLKEQMSKTGSVVNEYFNALQRMRDKESGKLPDIDYRVVRINAAIAAMQGMVSNPDSIKAATETGMPYITVAVTAVHFADALVEELKKGK